MPDTTLEFFGIPNSMTGLQVRVRAIDSGTILQTLPLSLSTDKFTATLTAAAAKGVFCVYEFVQSGTVLDSTVFKAKDVAGPVTVNAGLSLSGLSEEILTELNNADLDRLSNIPEDLETLISAIKAKTDLIGTVTFLVSTHLPDGQGTIHIKAGDRHEFVFTSDTADMHPDFTGQTLRFGIRDASGTYHVNTTNVDVVSGTGIQSVRLVLLPAVTLALENVSAFYDIQVEYAPDDIRTIFTGSVVVTRDHSGTA